MISAELNYNIYDKELFVIVVVFQTWKIYVKGSTNITVFIDYKNLIIFYIIKELNKRQIYVMNQRLSIKDAAEPFLTCPSVMTVYSRCSMMSISSNTYDTRWRVY